MVAQGFLNSFNVVSALKGCHGIAVTEVMKSGVRVTGLFDELLEVKIDGLRRKVMAQFIGKDQIQIIFLGRTGG